MSSTVKIIIIIVSILLIGGGGFLLYTGFHNKIENGKTKDTHTYEIIGGGVLVVLGFIGVIVAIISKKSVSQSVDLTTPNPNMVTFSQMKARMDTNPYQTPLNSYDGMMPPPQYGSPYGSPYGAPMTPVYQGMPMPTPYGMPQYGGYNF